jgi:Ca2+-binding RTX toxin-like protein
MAQAETYVGTSMPNITVWTGEILSYTSSRIVIDDFEGRRIVYSGSFSYDFWGNVSGTLQGMTEYRSGNMIYNVTGIGVSAARVYDAIQIRMDAGLAASIVFSKDDVMQGSRGADYLRAYAGNDTLRGGLAGDTLSGMSGRDTLIGGAGADTLIGGSGADRFVFAAAPDSAARAPDTIRDFHEAEGDLINLSGIDARSGVAGDQAFRFIGGAAFSDTRGELRYAGGVVSGDINGDGVADFRIVIAGGGSIDRDCFIL